MGYKYRPDVYKLIFEDPSFHGLEVHAKSTPIGVFMELSKLAAVELPLKPEDQARVQGMYTSFGEALVSWNVEDDNDEPIPATVEGMKQLDINFVLHIILAWMDSVGAAAGPLKQRSTPGTFPEESIPMETSSGNPLL